MSQRRVYEACDKVGTHRGVLIRVGFRANRLGTDQGRQRRMHGDRWESGMVCRARAGQGQTDEWP
jgi:hypothetical protein